MSGEMYLKKYYILKKNFLLIRYYWHEDADENEKEELKIIS